LSRRVSLLHHSRGSLGEGWRDCAECSRRRLKKLLLRPPGLAPFAGLIRPVLFVFEPLCPKLIFGYINGRRCL
jgi:hypothetical protein